MKKTARIVELAGLAGAGKSTIARTLGHRSWQVLVEEPPCPRRISDIPFFVRNTLWLLPSLLHLSLAKQGWRCLNRQEIAFMVILQGWHRRLERQLSSNDQVVILDQGPVFLLMRLDLYGPETLRSPSARDWWTRTCKQWADTLDTVIWLDAPTAILVDRIRARNTWHGVKEKPDTGASEYLARYRKSYEQVLSRLTANGDLQVLTFDTARESLNSVVDKLLLEFGLQTSDA